MKLKALTAAMLSAGLCTSPAFAGSVEDDLRLLKQRLDQMELQMQAQQELIVQQKEIIERQSKSIANNEAAVQEVRSTGGGGADWPSRVTVGGVVEIEAAQAEDFAGNDTSDITVATVELAIAAQINDMVSAEVVLLHEEDDTNLEVDIATITIGNEDISPFSLTAGQFFVPFGNFESHMISDPLTLEIGETRETAAMVSYNAAGVGVSGGVFKGTKDDDVEAGFLAAGYEWEGDDQALSIGGSYLSDLRETDGVEGAAVLTNSNDSVDAFSAYAVYGTGAWSFVGEYLGASDNFNNGREPSAFNIEAGYSFELGGNEATVAVGYQETDEAQDLGLPEERFQAGLSVGIYDATTLSFEYQHNEDYDVNDGGTGNDGHTITTQLAVEF